MPHVDEAHRQGWCALSSLVFAAGAVSGVTGEFWITPHLGHTTGVLFEAPFMLLAIIIVAMFGARHFAVPAPSHREPPSVSSPSGA